MVASAERTERTKSQAGPARERALTAAQAAALRLDDRAVRVARGQGAVELALGRTLMALFEGDRLLELGYARRKDYAVERLGVPARTMFAWVELARGLETRPLLRRAVVAGRVSPRKAREVLAAAVGADEARWTAAAMRCTLAELQARLRGEGHDPPDAFEVEALVLAMTAPQQDRLDAAIGLARAELGAAAPRWQCVEAICQEWLGTYGAWLPEEAEAEAEDAAAAAEAAAAPTRAALEAQLAAVDEALEVDLGFELGLGTGREAGAADDRADARSLQARVDRLMAARREFDATFGVVAERILATRAYLCLGYACLDEYSRERLGMSARSVRQRAWLERRLVGLPELRAALSSGRVPYSKALLVAKDATPADVAVRIEEAATTTWQQLERDSTAAEDRQSRAAGVRRLWGPRDAARTVADAIRCAQAWSAGACDRRIGAGEALAVIADHFQEVWGHASGRNGHRGASVRAGPRSVPRVRREILGRHGGLCAVPGCSRAAEHAHHIEYRSHGGSDASWNQVGLCAAHHLRGIHRGRLTVRGRAGEWLRWELGTASAEPCEVWITKGGDDVRRAG